MSRVLCVAEKPSIARAITDILSGGQYTTRNGQSQYNKNFDFAYPQTNSHYTVTSVSGHMLEHDFTEAHRKWHSCDPFELFDAPIETRVKQEAKQIEKNLRQEAGNANVLMIWTDCDREGENIGNEVKKVCRKSNRNIRVVRARFSAIIPAQIHNAAQHPVELDIAQSDAVEARTLLDLRLGAAFTRMQSLALQTTIGELDGTLISYGPCQFPTLGFVVSRYEQVKSFVPEQFWYIYLTLTSNTPGEGEVISEFTWKRHRLFDIETAFALYELVLENPTATVTRVTRKKTKKWKPYPLTTVELQKAASRILKLTPKKILDISESLYQKGFLSYPRTETDQFDDAFDFESLIAKQVADPAWGGFATNLQNGGFSRPRKGQKNDKAHPPIHPTAYAGNLNGDDKRVYEFIARRFLGCCSKDAEGFETTVDVLAGGEEFSATGLVVLERNYLDVYIYDKWSGKHLPNFEEGQEFMPTVCEMRDGTTSSPSYLTEADLVTLMDKNGIGTDATIAQHIQTVVDREYVMERMEGRTKYLVPSTLGIGLVEGYNKIGFEKSLSMPQLRRETERMMVQVCEGNRTKQQMIEQAVEQYRDVFIRARQNFAKVIDVVTHYVRGAGDGQADNGGGGGGGGGGNGGGGRGRGGGAAGRGQPRGGAPGRGRGNGGGGGGGGGGGNYGAPDPDSDSDGDAPPPPARAGRGRGASAAAAASSRNAAHGRAAQENTSRAPTAAAVSRTTNSGPNRNPNQAGSTPNCTCNIPAQELTVIRESANKGRRFWTCGRHPDKVCDFFEWVTGSSAGGGAGATGDEPVRRVVPAKRPLAATSGSNQSPNTGAGDAPVCGCKLPCVSRTVQKEGQNQGRPFWRCPKPQGETCDFFAWGDDPGGAVRPSGGSGGGGGGSGGGGSGECFKCGQQGHWSSACPNPDGQNKRTKSAAAPSASGAGSGRSCFKCGEEGHFSNACPNGDSNGSSRGGAGPAGGGSGGGGGGTCFKCGEEGHYSNACPNGDKASSSSSRGGRGGKRGTSGRGGNSRRSSSSSRGGGSKRGKKKFSAVS